MGKLSEHTSNTLVKMLVIGESGTGKTGALVSLAAAGYKLRIIDMDNGLDALVSYAKHQGVDLSLAEYETVRDKYKAGPLGPQVVMPPRAFTKAGGLLDKWSDGSKPEDWGPEYILVLDSLTHLGKAAYEWAKAANSAVKHKQIWYQAAQEAVEYIIATLTSETFKTNVVVISHIDWRRKDENDPESPVRGYVSSVGRKLGMERVPTYFNTLLLAQSQPLGKAVKRTIRTVPSMDIDLKNPAAFKMDAEYPLETGLASIFSKLKE